MHSYLRAIGFANITKESEVEKLLEDVYKKFDHREAVREDDTAFIEMEKEIAKYEKKYEELRMVSRAKCVLIEKEGYSEKDAHRYIEKQAMDSRESKARIAENIIKKYL